MAIELVHIGFGSILAINRLVALTPPNSAPTRRLIQEAREKGLLVDMTSGRRTKAVLITESGHVILAALTPETIASRQAAIALENAVLIRDLAEQRQRAEYLLGQSILAQEKERRRISLELHDTVAQRFVGACHGLQALEGQQSGKLGKGLKEIRDSLALGLRELRWAIEGLQPPVLEGGLVEALRRFGRAFSSETGLHFSLEVNGEPPRLSPLLEASAYRVAQEALTNVHKHAHATSVQMRVSFDGQGLTLKVGDDGQGFDPQQVQAQDGPSHLGLDGMRERAQALGGEVEVLSRPAKGTQVVLHLPVGV